jgi:hypothetical protein
MNVVSKIILLHPLYASLEVQLAFVVENTR